MNMYRINFKVDGEPHSCYIFAKHILDAINKAEDISLEYPYTIDCLREEDLI